jgi:hypothetical protein
MNTRHWIGTEYGIYGAGNSHHRITSIGVVRAMIELELRYERRRIMFARFAWIYQIMRRNNG